MVKSDNIFRRYELKYLLTEKQYEMLMDRLSEYIVPDRYGKNTILSLYYDTPDRRLIRKSIEHPEYKEKLRLRSYGVAKDDSKVYIELKKKYKGVVYKRRVSVKNSDAEKYLNQKTPLPKQGQIVDEIEYFCKFYEGIEPAMLLSYDRVAYVAKDDKNVRITFDRNILYREEDLSLKGGAYGTRVIAKNQVLMEIKVPSAMQMWLTQILSELKIYKTSFSKYGTAYMMSFKEKRERMKNCG